MTHDVKDVIRMFSWLRTLTLDWFPKTQVKCSKVENIFAAEEKENT